jgi:hypothetical protein
VDLRPYVDNLQRELLAAAEAGGGPEPAQVQRLLAQLEAATRLTLLDVVTDAADEITRELAPGSVHVRLSGREPVFVVTPAEPDLPASAAPTLSQAEPEDGGTWRINLRLPDHLKPEVEAAAAAAGLSVNGWLTRAVRQGLDGGDRRPRSSTLGQHYTGWAR